VIGREHKSTKGIPLPMIAVGSFHFHHGLNARGVYIVVSFLGRHLLGKKRSRIK
jgi:hypothetical protein